MTDLVTRRAVLRAALAAGAAWAAATWSRSKTRWPGRDSRQAPHTGARHALPSQNRPHPRRPGLPHHSLRRRQARARTRPARSISSTARSPRSTRRRRSSTPTASRDLNRRAARKWKGTTSFAALTAAQQDELLHDIEKTPFFQAARFDTIVGTFALPTWGGNRDYRAGTCSGSIISRASAAVRLLRRRRQPEGLTDAAAAAQRAPFSPSDTVDFVIVGSGAAGGIIAKELSTAGFSVVVLEQGPRLTEPSSITTSSARSCRQARQQPGDAAADVSRDPSDKAERALDAHLRAAGRRQQRALHRQFLAASPERFQRGQRARRRARAPASRTGRSPTTSSSRTTRRPSGSSACRASRVRSIRRGRRPYPMPPLPVKSSGVLLERGARRRSACIRSRRRWRSTRSSTTAGPRASTAASACSSCASSARSRRRW